MRYAKKRRRCASVPGKQSFTEEKAYFITLACDECVQHFGKGILAVGKNEIISDLSLGSSASILLSKCGWIAYYEWLRMARYFPDVEVDAFVIMPNHIHGILFLRENKDESYPEQKLRLGGIIGWYKCEVFNKCMKDGLWKLCTPRCLWRPHFKYYRIHNVEDYRSLKYYISRDSERWCKNEHPGCDTDE